MSHIFDNIRNIEAQAEICEKDQRQYMAMRSGGAERWELDAFIPRMDDNDHHFTQTVRELSLDNPAQMVRFIKAIKALGAVEALERIQEGQEFSNWVNLGLESWVNRITAEAHE
ncbi:hypothetical protein F9047_11555 [Escherichia coli]|uniref:Uncharacterized protein n=1 Tax=Cronobacter phage PBES 02 TaxID=1684115 RepID=A0A0K1YAN4_9CAUD|nr:hypothetical protein ADU18_0248 [Cronobacter phage PBES 02]AKY04142.1 hypothetical protein ADU18_0248 [Cronobacter phage PBES 02]KAB3178551.1 hypothetical protein F9047_11555 [Escherichia coli]